MHVRQKVAVEDLQDPMILCTSFAGAPMIPNEVKFLKVVPEGQRQGLSIGPQGGRLGFAACGAAEARGASRPARNRGVAKSILLGYRWSGKSARVDQGTRK